MFNQQPETFVIDVTRVTDDTLIDIQQLDHNAFLIDIQKFQPEGMQDERLNNDQGAQ